MSRPKCCRKIGCVPDINYYKPKGVPSSLLEEVTLTLDELETIKLADFEGFYQEQAAGVALDRVEIVSVSETISVPAGRFMKIVHVVETTPLERGKANKFYAAGIGAVKDDEMELVKYGIK